MDLSIIFLGDVMIARFIDRKHYIHKDVLHYLKSANVRICNFEGVISSNSPSLSTVKSRPSDFICKHGVNKHQAQILVDLDMSCCNLANNHILDYGLEGVKETIGFLNDSNIKWFGFGRNYEVAWKPRMYNFNYNACNIQQNTPPEICKNKVKIGLFGVSDHFIEWRASDEAGINYFDIKNYTYEGGGNPNRSLWTNIENIYEQIQKVRRKCDIIVFSIHWGNNFQDNVCETFRNFAHLLVDNDVDVIHGHSTHHTQGVEVYHSGVIIYGCGEFLNDYEVMEKALSNHDETLGLDYIKYNSNLSFLYKIYMKHEEKIKFCVLEMFPIQITDGVVNRCINDESRDILFKKMTTDCESLGTQVYQKDKLLYIQLD